MTLHVALLRAVNVGGHGKVAMADLRELFRGLGFDEAQTLLQSGNVVFRSAGKTATELEALLEAEAVRRLGLRSDILIRTAPEWADIVAANPFEDAAKRDPARLVVVILKQSVAAAAVSALRETITGPERLHAAGCELYIVYPDGIGTSRLTGNVIESRLGVRGTARNWNTVSKLAALARG